ncbi:MAG: cardiolipin synthase B [Alphaproteobacteria bacterium]|nr:cardiolipin synthase B [Alphaproteobacteria bacterium]
MADGDQTDDATLLKSLYDRALSRVADVPRSDGNAVRLMRDASENYPVWLAAIAGAKRTVHIENYMIVEDGVGRAFAGALIEAARRGVRVRVLYDWLGCWSRTSRHFWGRLRAAGVALRAYNPPRFGSPLGWISRDHRKLLVIDGEIAFAGGLCIGRDWVGDSARGVPPWRDTAVEVRGPAVAQLQAAFADSWAETGAPLPTEDAVAPEAAPSAGHVGLWVIPGQPGNTSLFRVEQLVVALAERRLWIADAYFVASSAHVDALCRAAAQGVDVRLLVPGSSDLPLVRAVSRSSFRPLIESGVRVFEWNGPMMHAKTAVADGCWSRVGSSNSNLSSWIVNRELDVAVIDRAFAHQMEAMFEHDIERSTEIVLDLGRIRRAAPATPRRRGAQRARSGAVGRLLAGAVGAGSVVGAVLSQQRALGPAEALMLATTGTLLLALAMVVVMAPVAIAYALALAGGWVGATLLARAWTLRAGRRAEGDGELP